MGPFVNTTGVVYKRRTRETYHYIVSYVIFRLDDVIIKDEIIESLYDPYDETLTITQLLEDDLKSLHNFDDILILTSIPMINKTRIRYNLNNIYIKEGSTLINSCYRFGGEEYEQIRR